MVQPQVQGTSSKSGRGSTESEEVNSVTTHHGGFFYHLDFLVSDHISKLVGQNRQPVSLGDLNLSEH